MVADTVSAIDIDIVSGIIPNPYYGKSRHNIRHKSSRNDKSALKIMKQQIISADDIYKNQIVD